MPTPDTNGLSKRQRLPRTMRSLLVLLLLVTLVPVLLVQVVIYRKWMQTRYQAEIQTNQEIARAGAATFEAYVRDVARQEGAVGTAVIALHPPANQQANEYLASSAAEYPSVRAFHWTDMQGRVLESSNPGVIGRSIKDQTYFRQALTAPRWVTSDLLPTGLTGGPTFMVARCIRNAIGQPEGVMVASVNLQRLEDVALNFERLKGGVVMILDRTGHVVCSYPATTPVWEQQTSEGNAFVTAALSGKEATGKVEYTDGRQWAVAYSPISGLGWAAGAGRAMSLVMAPVWNDMQTTSLATLAAILGSAVVALLVNHRINAGMAGLHDYVSALGRSESDHQPAVAGIAELNELAGAFGRMAANLRNSQDQTRQSLDRVRILNETLEERVAERTAIAEQRADQLRRLASQLTQVEQRERRRLAEVLHDHLQQLLVGAKLNLAGLQAEFPDAAGGPILRQVNDLLGESISVSRSLTAELSPPVLYDQGLAQALQWLSRRAQEQHGLCVTVHADPSANPVDEDARILLFQAVRELLFNIVKHAHTDHATVEMRRLDDDRLQIVVKDEGVGFDPTNRPKSRDSGGFGLFSIRERLQYLGGQMQMSSTPGRGTRVEVVAPLHPAADSCSLQPEPVHAAPHGDQHANRPAEALSPPISPLSIRVLLADDHEVVRNGLVRLLQMQPDIEVVGQASDGRQAVDLALEVRPDVVLMDVSMPRMNGVEAAQRIAAELPDVRIIGLSMHEEEDMATAMCSAGATAYLAKSCAGGSACRHSQRLRSYKSRELMADEYCGQKRVASPIGEMETEASRSHRCSCAASSSGASIRGNQEPSECVLPSGMRWMWIA